MLMFHSFDFIALECTLKILKPASQQVRGTITIRLEQRPNNTLSQDVVSEELSHLNKDMHSFLREEETDEEDPVGKISGLLDRMDPFMRIASMV